MATDKTHGRTVLVVDDDVIMRDVLAMMLGASGYEVRLAESGDAALAELANNAEEIHVVLTDMHMPGTQGAALARLLNEAIAPGTLVLGMSGSEPEPEEMKAFRAFLEKPFHVEAFEAAIERARATGRDQQSSLADPQTGTAVLNEGIFAKLQAMLPGAQLRELYRVTLGDVRGRVERMRAAVARGDMAECRAEAHSIKGGCGMVGASELSALAAAVERGAEAGNTVFANFDDACGRLQGMLEARIGD